MTAELLPFPKPSAKDAMDAPIGEYPVGFNGYGATYEHAMMEYAREMASTRTKIAVAQIRWWNGWARAWEDFWRAYWRRPW